MAHKLLATTGTRHGTVTTAVAELFAVFGSASLALTVVVLLTTPALFGTTMSVTVALEPASGPMAHVSATPPLALRVAHVPCVGEAET